MNRSGLHAAVVLAVLLAATASVAARRERSTSALAKAGALAPRAQPHDGVLAARGRALMRHRLACAGCHVIDSAGGGRVGPDLTTVRSRRDPEYIARMVDDPDGVAPGTRMPRTAMGRDVRRAVLVALGGDTSQTTGPRRVPGLTPRDAAALYAHYCASCHGDQGRGDGPNARWIARRPANHTDARAMGARTDDRLYDAIAAGGYPLGRSASMPAFGETLTRDEIASLVRYIRTLCRCTPPPWSSDGARGRGGR